MMRTLDHCDSVLQNGYARESGSGVTCDPVTGHGPHTFSITKPFRKSGPVLAAGPQASRPGLLTRAGTDFFSSTTRITHLKDYKLIWVQQLYICLGSF